MLPSGVHNTGEITVRMAYSQAPILFCIFISVTWMQSEATSLSRMLFVGCSFLSFSPGLIVFTELPS